MTSMARQRNMAQNKEQIKSPEKQLSNKEIAYLSEFKTLVIRMLTEMVEHGHKTQEKMRAMKSDIKGTNSEGKETGTKINGLEQKEEINISPEQNEETRIQKMRRGLGTSKTTGNVSASESQGCQEKRKNKKLKTYLNK